MGAHRLFDQFAQIQYPGVQAQGPGVRRGEHLEVVHDVLQEARLLLQRGEEVRVGLGQAVLRRVQQPRMLVRGVRSSWGDVAHHDPALLVGALGGVRTGR
ncbi:hypothetical protein AB7952_04830 [Streptomyces sp. PG2]